MFSTAELAARRDQLRHEIGAIGDLRPGSLVANYRRRGKSTYRCAAEDYLEHGPHWLLTRPVLGKTRTIRMRESQLPQTRAQIAECA